MFKDSEFIKDRHANTFATCIDKAEELGKKGVLLFEEKRDTI